MPTLYTRTFSFKDSLTDAQLLEEWRFLLEALSVVEKVNGIRSVKAYSGAGALRADITITFEMDDASAYERVLVDPDVRRLLGKVYGSWDMSTAGQSFKREVTPELIQALSSTG